MLCGVNAHVASRSCAWSDPAGGLGRLGWIADYPIIGNFVYPLFSRTSYDNYSFYTNRVVDGPGGVGLGGRSVLTP